MPNETPPYTLALLKEVRAFAKSLDADAFLCGTGSRDEDGAVSVDETTVVEGLADDFVKGYERVAKDDIVGMLFAAFPNMSTSQVLSVRDYTTDAGAKVAEYLGEFGVTEVCLTGLLSSFGLAWVTFYRKGREVPFTWQQAEDAARFVPYHLYRWQQQRCEAEPDSYSRTEKPARDMMPLTAQEMRIAIALANGKSYKEVSRMLGGETSTIHTHAANIYRKLGVTSKKLAGRLGDSSI